MPNGVIGNTTDSGSVKSRFEPWLGNNTRSWDVEKNLNFFIFFVELVYIIVIFAVDYLWTSCYGLK